jgi:hypothetical protein
LGPISIRLRPRRSFRPRTYHKPALRPFASPIFHECHSNPPFSESRCNPEFITLASILMHCYNFSFLMNRQLYIRAMYDRQPDQGKQHSRTRSFPSLASPHNVTVRVGARPCRAARQNLKVELACPCSSRSTVRPVRSCSRPIRPAFFVPALAELPRHFDRIALPVDAGLRAVSVDVGGRRLARWGLGSSDQVSPVRVGKRGKPGLCRDDGNRRRGGHAGRRI